MSDLDEIRNIIDEFKGIALSDDDIMKLMDGRGNIIRYADIKKYSTVEQLLSPHNVVFLLYEWKQHYGHWCVLIRSGDLIEFFDPYGGFCDSQLDNIPEPFRTESGQKEKLLSKLLLNYDGELSYNEYQFQELDQGIKDCGRWCVIRAVLKDMQLKDFKDLFMNIYKDDIATLLTINPDQIKQNNVGTHIF